MRTQGLVEALQWTGEGKESSAVARRTTPSPKASEPVWVQSGSFASAWAARGEVGRESTDQGNFRAAKTGDYRWPAVLEWQRV